VGASTHVHAHEHLTSPALLWSLGLRTREQPPRVLGCQRRHITEEHNLYAAQRLALHLHLRVRRSG